MPVLVWTSRLFVGVGSGLVQGEWMKLVHSYLKSLGCED